LAKEDVLSHGVYGIAGFLTRLQQPGHNRTIIDWPITMKVPAEFLSQPGLTVD